MKKFIHTIFAVLAIISCTPKAWSQTRYMNDNGYTNSIGLRLGTENGLTFKHFYRPTWAFEGTVTTGYRALVATALVEKHVEIFDTDGLNLLFGGGAHLGHWGRATYYRGGIEDPYYRTHMDTPSAGIDGIFGIEYKFPDIPFTIGADLKPFLDVFHTDDSWVEGAVSLRYVIN
jgi:hypothetical protein